MKLAKYEGVDFLFCVPFKEPNPGQTTPSQLHNKCKAVSFSPLLKEPLSNHTSLDRQDFLELSSQDIPLTLLLLLRAMVWSKINPKHLSTSAKGILS